MSALMHGVNTVSVMSMYPFAKATSLPWSHQPYCKTDTEKPTTRKALHKVLTIWGSPIHAGALQEPCRSRRLAVPRGRGRRRAEPDSPSHLCEGALWHNLPQGGWRRASSHCLLLPPLGGAKPFAEDLTFHTSCSGAHTFAGEQEQEGSFLCLYH